MRPCLSMTSSMFPRQIRSGARYRKWMRSSESSLHPLSRAQRECQAKVSCSGSRARRTTFRIGVIVGRASSAFMFLPQAGRSAGHGLAGRAPDRGYAEPIRRWLRQRFAAVHLVMFERLQFADASERVVLVIARGSGGCNAFSLLPVEDATDLDALRLFGRSHFTVAPAAAGKCPICSLNRSTADIQANCDDHCVPLASMLSCARTVTGRMRSLPC